MTNFEKIKKMNIEEMAEFFTIDKYTNFPPSPCYVCDYDKGLFCVRDGRCTDEYKMQVYQKWLESNAIEEEPIKHIINLR